VGRGALKLVRRSTSRKKKPAPVQDFPSRAEEIRDRETNCIEFTIFGPTFFAASLMADRSNEGHRCLLNYPRGGCTHRMTTLPSPISVLENYFDVTLTSNMASWKEVSDDTWVDFAKHYLDQMEAGFTPKAMAESVEGQKIRLYFDRRFGEAYDREIVECYARTPLIGLSPYPGDDIDDVGAGLSHALAPLKKHLLVADALYFPDNFYRCFDAVADSYDRHRWRDDPNIKSAVQLSVASILRWLPILAGLRELITSGAVNFLPYYRIPSFPWEGGNPFMTRQMERLTIPPDPGIRRIDETVHFDLSDWNNPPEIRYDTTARTLDCEGAVYAWINARLLGLDPVFADETTWRWASGIKFREETERQLTTDLMSIDILPLGQRKELSVQDIVSMRKDEEVFRHIRDTLIGCKEYVGANIAKDAASEFVSKTCREYIRDHLNPDERFKTIKFLDNNLFAGTALSIAVGMAFMAANPWVGLAVPAAFTPKAFLYVEGKFDPRLKAATRLEALL
jgi:hypothetical protein